MSTNDSHYPIGIGPAAGPVPNPPQAPALLHGRPPSYGSPVAALGTTSDVGALTVSTAVAGDRTGMRELSSRLSRLSAAADHARTVMVRAEGESTDAWGGSAGEGFRGHLRTHQRVSRVLDDTCRTVAEALTGLAAELAAVDETMALARADARAAGCPVHGKTIHLTAGPPMAAPTSAGAGTSERIIATGRNARRLEKAAHDRFQQTLDPLTDTFLDQLTTLTPTEATSLAGSTFTAAMKTDALVGPLAGHAEKSPRLATALAGATNLSTVLGYGAGNWITIPKTANPAWSKIPRAFTVSGAGLGVAGIGYDIVVTGTPADKAVVKGAAGWAAGATTSGVTAFALTALGFTGPAGWVAIGAGMIASAGVGYLIDQNWQ